MTPPLRAYAAGSISAGQAIAAAGLEPPRPSNAEVRRQVGAALPLLRAALRERQP